MSTKYLFIVTGGAGFIGSNFVRYILDKKRDVFVVNIDNLTYAGNLENIKDINSHNHRFFQKDINDISGIKEIIKRFLHRKKYIEKLFIVNFAAQTHVDRSILERKIFITTNVNGVVNLLDLALYFSKKLPVRFIQISTDEVYGSISKGKFKESSPLSPSSPYSSSKAAADLITLSYYKTYDLDVCITRSSNNYGPYQFPEKLIPLMINNALNKKILPVYGDGKNIRDWLYVKDNCEAILKVAFEGKKGEIYNIGGNQELENIKVVYLICEIIAKIKGIAPEELYKLIRFVKDRPGHDRRYAVSITKIKKQLKWKPIVKFEEGLYNTVRWYIENQKWVKAVIDEEYKRYYKKQYGGRL